MSENNSWHILVVDDALMILDLKEEILESEGYGVTTMRRQNTGVQDILTVKPDLLIMEYIPQEDSSLMDELATDPRTRQIPVLLCTGSSREVGEVSPKVDEMGIRFISKPFDIDEFLTAVRDLIGASAEAGQG